MYAFKFVSVSAIFLLALMQGAVSETIAGPALYVFTDFFYVVTLTVFYKGASGLTCCILGPDNGICEPECVKPVPLGGACVTIAGSKPCVAGLKCCVLGPDNGICSHKCPPKTPY
ncbi:hypothetical protein GGX14DRAFT_390177 [Mycena pura]|uniref:Uncharacterized protein n=1 Tax=Mycena pura TaxID=153505 RepID=A0AAD6YGB3_9AGAR|nr:hypothetical protein GGX14DRAFT_390177 [Mycena pura]